MDASRREFGWKVGLAANEPSRAVSKSKNSGTPGMLGVKADRIDHEGQFVGVIDYASSVEGHTGPDVSFDKVMPINAQRVAVAQPGHLVRRAFRQREQEWLAQLVDLTATAGLAPKKI